MSDDNVQENPTSLNNIGMTKKEPKKMTKLLEVYLKEFCEVMGIAEKELPTQVIVYFNPQDKFIGILSVEDRDIVKIGVKMTDEGYEISGEYLTEKEKFPKTTKYADSLNGRNLTRDTAYSKGE